MTIDKIDFYYQAVKRICGNLDIESALWNFLQYLQTVIPVTGMNLHLFAPDLGYTRIIANATLEKYKKMDRIIDLPENARKKIAEDWSKMKEVMIINTPGLYPVIRSMPNIRGKSDASIMVMSLEMEGERLGGLTVFSHGKFQYTREHADMLSWLHDPFAIALSNALKHEEVLKLKNMLVDDNKYLSRELLRISGDKIIGQNNGLKTAMNKVHQVARLNSPVLLLGETGVGKEVIANAIHFASNRKDGPFIKVNCGAIPESLMDSELFGHEKGAFTGAVKQKRGRFERAHKGTILLDEIGELTFQAQVRLLRVIQEKEINRVGGTNPINIDIRIIAATNRDLQDMVVSKDFRKDLWFRLNVFPITIPPLRERKEDLPNLVRHFVERKSSELGFQELPLYSKTSLNNLMSYNWPGNVRELENMVERALIQNRGQNEKGPLRFEISALPEQKREKEALPDFDADLPKLDELASRYIRKVLKLTNGRLEGPHGAARILDIHPNTLRNRMKKLGIPFGRNRKQ
jgi:transcriptional regulator with GAF, ATPase, and Fis domain